MKNPIKHGQNIWIVQNIWTPVMYLAEKHVKRCSTSFVLMWYHWTFRILTFKKLMISIAAKNMKKKKLSLLMGAHNGTTL